MKSKSLRTLVLAFTDNHKSGISPREITQISSLMYELIKPLVDRIYLGFGL